MESLMLVLVVAVGVALGLIIRHPLERALRQLARLLFWPVFLVLAASFMVAVVVLWKWLTDGQRELSPWVVYPLLFVTLWYLWIKAVDWWMSRNRPAGTEQGRTY